MKLWHFPRSSKIYILAEVSRPIDNGHYHSCTIRAKYLVMNSVTQQVKKISLSKTLNSLLFKWKTVSMSSCTATFEGFKVLGVTINKNHFQIEWNYRKCKLRVYPVNNVQKQPDVDVSVQINLVSFAKIKDGQKSFSK